MMSDDQVVLRGFDMPMPEIGDQLHFRMPLLSFRSSPELYVAGRVDWDGDTRALTIVDDSEDLEMATLLTDGVEHHVASGEGAIVAGAEFFHATSCIGFPLYGFRRVAVTDGQCWLRVATPSAFVSLRSELVDKSRSVFDRELREAIDHGRRLTERGNAAMLILRRCGPLRSVGLTIRQLSAAMQNRNFHLYRRLIDRLEYELGEPEERSHEQAERHVRPVETPERVHLQWLNMPLRQMVPVYEAGAEHWSSMLLKRESTIRHLFNWTHGGWVPGIHGLAEWRKSISGIPWFTGVNHDAFGPRHMVGNHHRTARYAENRDNWEEVWSSAQSV